MLIHAAQPEPLIRSSRATMVRMSVMMFLQYWPLGIWGVTVGTFIDANTGDQGDKIFSAGFVGYSTAAGALGSLLMPVIIGFLSDRYVAAERLLAITNAGCALAAWGMFASHTQGMFFLWLIVYFQCFVPATALTNKIGLAQLANMDAEYPRVRIFSTIGWISAGLFLGLVWPAAAGASVEATRQPLMLGAWGSALMALYALTLPHTPPDERTGVLSLRSFRDCGELLRNRPLVLFLLASLLACVPSMAYNNFGNVFLNRQGFPHPAALMTLGQVSDVLVLWATPWLIERFGLRVLFAAGVVAWCLRYSLLAASSYFEIAWPAYPAILIHGVCFVFIYVIGVMYVERLVAGVHRGVAQGMYALASTGVGHLLGAFSVGYSQERFLTPGGVSPPPYHWTEFWMVPAILSAVTIVVLSFAFRSHRSS